MTIQEIVQELTKIYTRTGKAMTDVVLTGPGHYDSIQKELNSMRIFPNDYIPSRMSDTDNLPQGDIVLNTSFGSVRIIDGSWVHII